MEVIQIIIFTTSAVSIHLLTGTSPKLRLAGCLAGLAGQPCWIWTSYEHAQWGILALSCWYTWSFLKGAYLARAEMRASK